MMRAVSRNLSLWIGHDGCKALDAYCRKHLGRPCKLEGSYGEDNRLFAQVGYMFTLSPMVQFHLPNPEQLTGGTASYWVDRKELMRWLDQHAPDWEDGVPWSKKRLSTRNAIDAEVKRINTAEKARVAALRAERKNRK